MIRFSNVNPLSKSSKETIFNLLKKNILRNEFILGKNTEKFEKNFSKFENFKYGIGCSSGTDALILAIRSLMLKDNDEIILPGLSYISTLYSPLIVSKNFKIKFVDIDIKTGLMDLESLKKKISKKTKLVIFIHH